MLNLSDAQMYDKVYGCWMGKNCGGTLGTPLEKGIGEPEPFDVWWYPKLQEGGIPNDDLEMQLVWLKAFEDHGPGLNAHHLAEYWLNHIGYNWDEYGWARMNLRLGLLPPVSGNYNNWFVDCMGCPIRSEIFACLAPGLPRLAVQYAYQDAIVDHAGGESVYGEMFNTAIEASAFLVSDLNELLDIGRSYVADGSKTALAIDAARAAHAAGLDWKAARKKVLQATPHYNSQYSPINMGFQTIGLLYGKDFADSLCIAVNCGYDTDCTGATVGSILGIIHGQGKLPPKWTQPLGDTIATNESWGGLKNCSVGPNPIPKNLHELTVRTLAMATRISAGHTPSRDNLYADDACRALWKLPATCIHFPLGVLTAGVEYHDTPAVVPSTIKKIRTHLANSAPVPLAAHCVMDVPAGWTAPQPQKVVVPALGQVSLDWSLAIPAPQILENSNTLYLKVQSPQRAAQLAAPIVLIGARRLRLSQTYTLAKPGRAELLDHPFPPEQLSGDPLHINSRPGPWTVHPTLGHDLLLQSRLPAGHAIYVQAFIHSDSARTVVMGVPTTGAVKSWVNGQLLHNFPTLERFRPHGHKTQAYLEVNLQPGDNEILLKLVHPTEDASFDAHLIFVDPKDHQAGIIDMRWTRLPTDQKG